MSKETITITIRPELKDDINYVCKRLSYNRSRFVEDIILSFFDYLDFYSTKELKDIDGYSLFDMYYNFTRSNRHGL